MDKLFSTVCTFQGQLSKNVALSKYTSWRTGGKAAYVYKPDSLDDLSLFLRCLLPTIPVYWLGLGSNTLVRDGGIEAIVMITQGALNRLQTLEPQLIRAEVGVSSAQLARYTARAGLTGLEFMAGIPGTIGGALAMNAGCNKSETWRFVKNVQMIDQSGVITTYGVQDFDVSYRQVDYSWQAWFVSGDFFLRQTDKAAALQCIRDLLAERTQTQPMGTANCGSVFRNPPGYYAGELIEACGLKGLRCGGAIVSNKHANFILNQNNASSADIENLMREIQEIVKNKTGIHLVPEVCIIGRP